MKLNHLVFCVFDSARYDSMVKAKTPNIDLLGEKLRRFSFASWTAPSHTSLLMGQLPHASPPATFATEVYRRDLLNWRTRVGNPKMAFETFLPQMSLPAALKKLGYETHAFVSMPVLNPQTIFPAHFDSYRLMPRHNDFNEILNHLDFSGTKPQFYFLNTGETHYPYALPSETKKPSPSTPRIHGLHGTIKWMGDGKPESLPFFSQAQLKAFHRKQVDCIEYLDTCVERLYQMCPKNTHIILTSDHGELFGEGGFFGHGAIMHKKVFEVPLIEGMVPH